MQQIQNTLHNRVSIIKDNHKNSETATNSTDTSLLPDIIEIVAEINIIEKDMLVHNRVGIIKDNDKNPETH